MIAKQVFRAVLRLYPADYRKTFSSEMWAVLEMRWLELSEKSWRERVGFVFSEVCGLAKGAGSEWAAKIANREYSLRHMVIA